MKNSSGKNGKDFFKSHSKILLASSVALLLAFQVGCTAIGFLYDRAPYLLSKRISNDFDLSSAQKAEVRKSFDSFILWHRSQELPKYRNFLAALETRATERLVADDIRWATAQFLGFRKTLFDRVYPEVGPFLKQVSAEQLKAFEKAQAERNEERFEDLEGSDTEIAEKKAEKWTDRIETWTGRLTQPQRELIQSFSRNTLRNDKQRRIQTLRSQKEFLIFAASLRGENSQISQQGLVAKLWDFTQPLEGTEQLEFNVTLLTGVAESLDAKQLKHFKKQLQVWQSRIGNLL